MQKSLTNRRSKGIQKEPLKKPSLASREREVVFIQITAAQLRPRLRLTDPLAFNKETGYDKHD